MLTKFLPFLFFLSFPFLLLVGLPFTVLRYILIGLLVVSVVIYSAKKYGLSKLGLLGGFRTSHLPLILSTILIAFAIFILKSRLVGLCPSEEPFRFLVGMPFWFIFATYALVSVPFQELVYRSFLVNLLEELRISKKLILLIGAILFALVHIAWGKYTAFGAFWLGLYWVWLFKKTRSFWLLLLSHLVIGSAAAFVLCSCC